MHALSARPMYCTLVVQCLQCNLSRIYSWISLQRFWAQFVQLHVQVCVNMWMRCSRDDELCCLPYHSCLVLQGGMMPGMGRPPMMNNYNNYGNYGSSNYGNYGMPPMMQQPQPPMYGGPGRGGMGPRGRGQPAGRMVSPCPNHGLCCCHIAPKAYTLQWSA